MFSIGQWTYINEIYPFVRLQTCQNGPCAGYLLSGTVRCPVKLPRGVIWSINKQQILNDNLIHSHSTNELA